MLMTILVIFLIVFVGLLIVTVLRDKKKQMAARNYGNTSSQGGRRQASANSPHQEQKEPTLNQMDKATVISQEEFSDAKLIVEDQTDKKLSDTDEILGLKRKVSKPNNNESWHPETQKQVSTIAKTKSTYNKRIVIFLKASPETPYAGYELLQALLANHFRFGEMSLFHRHERLTGEGQKLFSLAAATKTGTFDLTKMGGFSCNGLSLFLSVTEQTNPLKALDLMIETAHHLVEDLGGIILDENQKPINADKIQHWREDIQNILQGNMLESVYS